MLLLDAESSRSFCPSEPNMRFLALEGLSALARNEATHNAVQAHQTTVTKLLHVCIRLGAELS